MRSLLFHCKKSIPRSLVRNSSFSFAQQSRLKSERQNQIFFVLQSQARRMNIFSKLHSQVNSSISMAAFFKSIVSKPSVNQP